MTPQRSVRQQYKMLLKSIEWTQLSHRLIDERGSCWQCGAEDDLVVHHLVYRDGKRPWEYADHELRVLCKDCHDVLHVVADEIWVECLALEPHNLERVLKYARQVKDDIEKVKDLNRILGELVPPKRVLV